MFGGFYSLAVASMRDKLQVLVQRYNEIELLLAQPDVVSDVERLSRLAKERAHLSVIVQVYQRYQKASQAMEEARELANGDDAELAPLAKEELPQLLERQERTEQELKQALLGTPRTTIICVRLTRRNTGRLRLKRNIGVMYTANLNFLI